MSDNQGFEVSEEMISRAVELLNSDLRFPLGKVQREFKISMIKAFYIYHILLERGLCKPFEPRGRNPEGDCFERKDRVLATTEKLAEAVPLTKNKGYHRKSGKK